MKKDNPEKNQRWNTPWKILLKVHFTVLVGMMCISSNLLAGQDAVKSDTLIFPLRGAFYYSWYPQTWTVGGAHVFYNPELGYYNSDDVSVATQHVEDLEYAKIDVAIFSWWRIESHNQAYRFPLIMDKTVEMGAKVKWAVYYEMEGFSNPTVEELKSNLKYIKENYTGHEAYAHIDGKPVVFVYNANDNSCDVTDRWAQATNGEWYVNLKVFGGFRDCANQPDSWHQYGPSTRTQRHNGYSFVISPGFWRADESTPRLARDPVIFNQNVRTMIESGEPWQLVTTFNEWGEGTAIERCYDWTSNTLYGKYLDALHFDGVVQTSVNDPAAENRIHLYYSPGNELIVVSNTKDVILAEIYPVNGSLLKSVKIDNQDSFNILANDFPGGLYILKITLSSGDVQVEKFINLNNH
jgi:hypothetical protein